MNMRSAIFSVGLAWAMMNLSGAQASDPLHGFIVGGAPVSVADPIAATTVLIHGKIQRASFTCTGSIIAEDLILTAGHCLGGGGYADLTVYFRTDINGAGPSLKVIKQMRMTDQIPESEYDWDDLAILRLEKPIPKNYRPAKLLDPAEALHDGDRIILAGYGRTNPYPAFETRDAPAGSDASEILRSVEQNILKSQYTAKEVLVDIHGKGACFGDSGGPALIQKDKELYLFGVASRLTERDRIADDGRQKRYACIVDMVYSSIAAQMAWIRSTSLEIHK